MTLSELSDANDGDHHSASAKDLHDFNVYDEKNERIGKVVKAEIAGLQHSPYLIIKVGSWLANRQVLLPLRSYQIDLNAHRINIGGWSREEISQLPSYPIQAQIEDAYVALEASAPLESGAALEAPIVRKNLSTDPVEPTQSLREVPTSASTEDKTTTRLEPSARVLDEQIIPLLAERVIVDRHKRKSGEVVIRKVIETEVIEVIVRREKLIVEQVSPEYKELAVIDLGRTSVEETPPSPTKDNDS